MSWLWRPSCGDLVRNVGVTRLPMKGRLMLFYDYCSLCLCVHQNNLVTHIFHLSLWSPLSCDGSKDCSNVILASQHSLLVSTLGVEKDSVLCRLRLVSVFLISNCIIREEYSIKLQKGLMISVTAAELKDVFFTITYMSGPIFCLDNTKSHLTNQFHPQYEYFLSNTCFMFCMFLEWCSVISCLWWGCHNDWRIQKY